MYFPLRRSSIFFIEVSSVLSTWPGLSKCLINAGDLTASVLEVNRTQAPPPKRLQETEHLQYQQTNSSSLPLQLALVLPPKYPDRTKHFCPTPSAEHDFGGEAVYPDSNRWLQGD